MRFIPLLHTVAGLVLAWHVVPQDAHATAITNYLVTFERDPITIQGGETFSVPVYIQPAPPPGLFSFGVRLRIESTNAVISGVGAIQVPPALAFNGPYAASPVVAASSASAAVKGTAVFYSTSLQPATNVLLATFLITDRAPGSYRLSLDFFNTLGPTEDIFVDGNGAVLDRWITFGSTTVVRGGTVTNEIRTAITLNRQTGLFEQTVRVTNTRTVVLPAFLLLVTNVPSTWTVWNAHGQTNGLPFFLYNAPLAPGGYADLRVEYRIPNRLPNAQPGYIVIPASPTITTNPPPGSYIPLSPRLALSDGSFLLEFSSLANRYYAMQYSADLLTWQTVVPSIRGNGSRVQWIDYGPPKTVSPPSAAASRYYRLFLLPE